MPYFRVKHAHQSEFVSERVRTFRSFAVFRAHPSTQQQRSAHCTATSAHIGAKPLSGQAKPTSKAHFTATMRASFALITAFAAAMSNTAFNGNMGVASAQRRFDGGPNIVSIRSCDEFPGRELDAIGTVTFLREINCREPTVRGV